VTAVGNRRRCRRRLDAVVVALVADRPVAAVHPVGIVAEDVDVVENEVVATDEMFAGAVDAVPVLAAVVGIGIPAAGQVAAVQQVTAVRGRRRSCCRR